MSTRIQKITIDIVMWVLEMFWYIWVNLSKIMIGFSYLGVGRPGGFILEFWRSWMKPGDLVTFLHPRKEKKSVGIVLHMGNALLRVLWTSGRVDEYFYNSEYWEVIG